MYSRNMSVRTEVTPQNGLNRYRYAMPPQYGGSRFRRQNSEVIALPDSAFSASAEEKDALGTEVAASAPDAGDTVSDGTENTTAAGGGADAAASVNRADTAATVNVPDTAETAGLAERLGGLLGDVGKDDLLLAAVIVLLYAEKRGSGTIDNELVLILAILLGTR